MSTTIGCHLITTTYGTWLPGDARGHWSPAIGPDGRLLYPPGGVQPGDPETEAKARQRMKQAAVVLSPAECQVVADAFGRITQEYRYAVYAAAIRPTHVHWVVGDMDHEVSRLVGRYKGIAGKAVRAVRGPGSVWTDGYFAVFLYSEQQMQDAIQYVERHNLALGMPARLWGWVVDWRG